jgi:ribonuclease Z
MGRCPENSIHLDTVLITHGHMDHIGCIGHHCARRELLGLEPPTYVIGTELVHGFETLMAAWRLLDGSKLRYNLVVLSPGEEYRLYNGMVVRPFRAHHVVPTQGYGIWHQKRKLLPQYQGLPGREIALLRENGTEVSSIVEYPLVAFTGDTRASVLDEEEVCRTAKLLIMEITFIDNKVSPDKALRTWHTHIDHVVERARLFENDAVLFTHRSMRHSEDEFAEALLTLPEPLRSKSVPLRGGFG